MKKKLYVIDLDNTLLECDSFTLIIKRHLSLYLVYIGLARKLKLISRYQFAKKATQHLENRLNEEQIHGFVKTLDRYVNNQVMDHIRSRLVPDATLLIISASPNFYVSRIDLIKHSQKMGSFFKNSYFYHLYGDVKYDYITQKYPQNLYDYYYAITDSLAETAILNHFTNSYIVCKNQIVLYGQTHK